MADACARSWPWRDGGDLRSCRLAEEQLPQPRHASAKCPSGAAKLVPDVREGVALGDTDEDAPLLRGDLRADGGDLPARVDGRTDIPRGGLWRQVLAAQGGAMA